MTWLVNASALHELWSQNVKCVRNITSAITPLLAARAATAQKKELLMWQTQNVIKPVGNASKFGLCVL